MQRTLIETNSRLVFSRTGIVSSKTEQGFSQAVGIGTTRQFQFIQLALVVLPGRLLIFRSCQDGGGGATVRPGFTLAHELLAVKSRQVCAGRLREYGHA